MTRTDRQGEVFAYLLRLAEVPDGQVREIVERLGPRGAEPAFRTALLRQHPRLAEELAPELARTWAEQRAEDAVWRRAVRGRQSAAELLGREDHKRNEAEIRRWLGADPRRWRTAVALLTRPEHGTLPEWLADSVRLKSAEPDEVWDGITRAIPRLLAMATLRINREVVDWMGPRGRRFLAWSACHPYTVQALAGHREPAIPDELVARQLHDQALRQVSPHAVALLLLELDDPRVNSLLVGNLLRLRSDALRRGGPMEAWRVPAVLKGFRFAPGAPSDPPLPLAPELRAVTTMPPGAPWPGVTERSQDSILRECWDAADPRLAAQSLSRSAPEPQRAPFTRLVAARTVCLAGRFDLLARALAGEPSPPEPLRAALEEHSVRPVEEALLRETTENPEEHQRQVARILAGRYPGGVAHSRVLTPDTTGRRMAAEPFCQVDWPVMVRALVGMKDSARIEAMLHQHPDAAEWLPVRPDVPDSLRRIFRDRAAALRVLADHPAGQSLAGGMLRGADPDGDSGATVTLPDVVRAMRPAMSLPTALLADEASGWLRPAAERELTAVLREFALTAGPEQWAILYPLLPGFAGTLPDLLTTTQAIGSQGRG